MELLYVISVVNTLIMMWLEKYMDLHKYGTMVDTFSREYYDENDKYYKFWFLLYGYVVRLFFIWYIYTILLY